MVITFPIICKHSGLNHNKKYFWLRDLGTPDEKANILSPILNIKCRLHVVKLDRSRRNVKYEKRNKEMLT